MVHVSVERKMMYLGYINDIRGAGLKISYEIAVIFAVKTNVANSYYFVLGLACNLEDLCSILNRNLYNKKSFLRSFLIFSSQLRNFSP